MKHYYFIILVICVLLLGCQSQTNRDMRNDFHTIDFVQCFETEQPFLLSEIADSIEYLELKTPEDIVITKISNIKFLNEDLLILANSDVYQFTRDGQFVKKIGGKGQGPGEHIGAADVEVDYKKKEIIIKDLFKTLFYDFNGNFLRTTLNFASMIAISDSILWTDKVPFVKDKYNAFALDANGDTIATIPNPIYGKESKNRRDVSIGGSIFYHRNGLLFYKCSESSDTILKISGAKIEPYAYINMGKYKLPAEYEIWYSVEEFISSAHKYWGVPFIAEDDRYFFLLSRTRRPQSGGQGPLYKYIVYDKKNKKGFTAKNNEDFMITDDILGGPPIWPRWVTEKYYINVVECYELQETVEAGDYSPVESLKTQISGVGVDTNQLIILCHRKGAPK